MARTFSVKIKVDGDQIVSMSKQSGDAMDKNLGGGARAAGTQLNALKGHLAAIAGVFAAGGLLRSIIDTGAAFQGMRVQLETVTGSAANANAAFDQIKEFAASTPFQVENITDSFVRLAAVGIEPTMETMRSIGNTAAAFGKDVTQFSQAVVGAAFGEMEMLKQFGIVARQQGDSVKFTFKGVTTEVGKNAEEIVAFLTKIGETDFAGAMERQSKTFNGRVSTMKDAWANFQDTIAQAGLLDLIQDLVEGATDLLTEFDRVVNSSGFNFGNVVDHIRVVFDMAMAAGVRILGGGIAAIVGLLASGAEAIVNIMDRIPKGLRWVFGVRESTENRAQEVAAALRAAHASVKRDVDELAESFEDLAIEISNNLELAKRAGKETAEAAEVFQETAKDTAAAVVELGSSYEGVIDAVAKSKQGFSASADVIEDLAEKGRTLALVFGDAELSTEALGAVLLSLKNLAAKGVLDPEEYERAMEALGDKVVGVAADVSENVQDLWTDMAGIGQDAMTDLFTGTWDGFDDLLQRMLQAFLEWAAKVAAQKILLNVAGGAAGAAGSAAGGAAQAAGLIGKIGKLFGGGGAASGSASTGAMAGLTGALAVVAGIGALYFAIDKWIGKNKAKKTVASLTFAVESAKEIGIAVSGNSELNEAMVAGWQALKDVVAEVETLTGGIVESLPEIEVTVAGTGKILARVAGRIIGEFEDFQEALDAAVTQALRSAELSGAHEIFQQVLQSTTATSMEELQQHLEFAGEVLRLAVGGFAGEVAASVGDVMAMVEQAAQLGIDAAIIGQAMGNALQDISNQIQGINVGDFADKLQAALEFNESIAALNEDLQAQLEQITERMEELSSTIERLGGQEALEALLLGAEGAEEIMARLGDNLADMIQEYDSLAKDAARITKELGALGKALPIDLGRFSQQIIAQFAGLTGLAQSLAIDQEVAQLRQALQNLGLDSATLTQRLLELGQAERFRRQQLEGPVLETFFRLWEQTGLFQTELQAERARLSQAQFQIELEMVRIQLNALNLMTDVFENVLNALGEWAQDIGNFMGNVNIPGVGNVNIPGVPDIPGGGSGGGGGGAGSGTIDTTEQDLENLLSILDGFINSDAVQTLNEQLQELHHTFFGPGGYLEQAIALGVPLTKVVDAFEAAVKALTERVFEGLQDFLDSLQTGPLSLGTLADQFQAAQARYNDLVRRAQGGDLEAIEQLPAAAQEFLELAQAMFGSGSVYQEILAGVMDTLQQLLDDREEIERMAIEGDTLVYDGITQQTEVLGDLAAEQLTELQSVRTQLSTEIPNLLRDIRDELETA